MRTREHPTRGPRRSLRADDPAELLAEARLSMGIVPRDCLMLLGHERRSEHCVISRIPLDPVPVEDCTGEFHEVMRQMMREGCTGAFGVLVLRDGYERGPDETTIAEALRWCALTLIAAQELSPDPFDIPELWVLADAQARCIRVSPAPPDESGERAYDLALRDPQPLAPLEDTRAAAHAVAAGIPLPQERPEVDAALAAARPCILSRRGRLPTAPIEMAWQRTLAALARLGREESPRGSEEYVTDCEHVAALLDICGQRSGIDQLLTLALPADLVARIPPGGVVDVMLTDPSQRPGRRISAGGHWYEALRTLRWMSCPPPAERGRRELAQAWITLSHALGILAWWNYRCGTAGDLAQEVLTMYPDEPLALCLREMARVPITPAWHPRR
ncbi:hypothetical protein [Brachybacterium hainanense]|uniref:DUF4192 family protein n=1 Tax=Brachybacterium hainanense TaxID=1541174 RepID=A0ABV6RG54_9MICO